jgi:hypothetical protein
MSILQTTSCNSVFIVLSMTMNQRKRRRLTLFFYFEKRKTERKKICFEMIVGVAFFDLSKRIIPRIVELSY